MSDDDYFDTLFVMWWKLEKCQQFGIEKLDSAMGDMALDDDGIGLFKSMIGNSLQIILTSTEILRMMIDSDNAEFHFETVFKQIRNCQIILSSRET